ncbi:MAG: TIGR02300 family protein [Rhodobacteraceae bacterium]|nr:TIGR02300 family protein [Paracoccaceae bacterium]
MSNEWGVKHFCENCGIKFYDLSQSPIVCPQCGTSVEIFFSGENQFADDTELLDIDLEVPIEEIKPSGVEVKDEVDNILDDEDTVSLDEIKNVSTQDTE